jgi:hypothetical protein
MMGKEKSAKGQKIGRNSRSASSKLQAQRTARNKAKRQAANKAQGVPQPMYEVREVRAERKEMVERAKHLAHKKAFREHVEAVRKAEVDRTILGDGGVKLTVPKGLNPKDYKEAMKARIRAHRQTHGIRRAG